MMKKQLLRTMLLLFALVAGSSSAWGDDTYSRITSTNDLEVGEKYIIVSETNKVAMGTVSSDKGQGISVTISDNTITLDSKSTVNVFTLGGNSDGYTLLGSQDSKYIGYNSGTKLAADASASTNSYKWTITFSGNNASIANVATTSRLIRGYNSNKDFRAYGTSNGSDVQLYKKVTASGPITPSVTIPSTTIGTGATTTISFPEDLTTISFESDNESVATVSDAGVVTGVAAGSATITATWSAIADKYNAGSQEFNVTVVAATVYNKVTSVTQLVAGNEYIVVAPKSNMAMGAQSSSIRTNVSVTIANDQVAITNEEVAVLTLGGSYGAWTFLASDNGKYLALTSSSNALHASDDAKANGAKWTITEDFQLANVEYNTRVLKYNSGSPRFACYTSGQQTAVLFVKAGSAEVTTVPVTITDAEYATFVAPYPLDFSETGITAYTAKANTSSVALTEVTQVPAGATVVLYKAGADGTAINVPVIATADALENNDLVAGPVTGDGASYYALGKEGAKVGFGILANGTELPANKAYIAASKFGAGAPAFMPFDFGGTTDISEKVIVKSEKFATAPVYNLAGQRVMNPSKGLFIMNGKKVAIK